PSRRVRAPPHRTSLGRTCGDLPAPPAPAARRARDPLGPLAGRLGGSAAPMSLWIVTAIMALAAAFVLGIRAGWWAWRKLMRKGFFQLREDLVPIHVQPHEPGALSFFALGDVGTGNDDQRAVAATLRRLCTERRCDFVLMLGDNFYNHGVGSI